MNKMLMIVEEKLAGIKREKEDFVPRLNDAVSRLQANREALSAAEHHLREAEIDAYWNEGAKREVSKKQQAVTQLQADAKTLDIGIEALERRIVDIEKRFSEAELELKRTKIELLLERCTVDRESYITVTDEYAKVFKRLSVCVDALHELGGVADLKKRFPELLHFPRPISNSTGSQSVNIMQLSFASNGELQRLVPFVIGKEERSRILDSLLE